MPQPNRPDAPPRGLLADRVVLVTGAARGLGAATAVACAEAGAAVAVCDRDAEGLEATATAIERTGRLTETSVMDVRDPEAVAELCSRVGATFGRVDVLVNNAGGTFRSAFLDVSPKGQRSLVDENFTSVTDFVRECLPLMPDGGGAIVNITSVEAHRGAPTFAIYAAMKAAVTNLTKSLAVELGPRLVRVNAIAPDAIATPGDSALAAEMDDAARDRTAFATPLARAGTPQDVADAVVFLASDMARFVTGTVLHVDGGSDAARGWRLGADGRWHP